MEYVYGMERAMFGAGHGFDCQLDLQRIAMMDIAVTKLKSFCHPNYFLLRVYFWVGLHLPGD